MGWLSRALDRVDRDEVARQSADRAALAEVYTLPSVSGDVAQVADLSAEVAVAMGINVASDRVSREEALTVPAVRRGRQIIAGTLGTAPLLCIRQRAGGPPERVSRQLLEQPDPDAPASYTVTQTVDSLLFHGIGWWRVLDRDPEGFPSRAEWLRPSRVMVDVAAGTVRVDGKPVRDRDVIRFDAPDEGILKHGGRAIRTYLLLEDAVRRFSRLDIPLGFLADQEGALEPDEVNELLNGWEAALKRRTTPYLPQGLKYESPVLDAQKVQLSEARQQQAAEIARLMNLPPSAVNAPTADSLTYATTEGNRRELIDLTLAPYVASITGRLSMNDVTPRGSRVAMDLGAFQRGDLASVITAGSQAVDAGLLTVDEVRTLWLDLPPTTAPATEEQP